jgi:hypothetical protein
VAPTDTGRRVADAFLEQIRAGQVDAAWQSTTAEFKSDEGRESFARLVKSKPIFKAPLTFASYEVTDLNTLKRGQCIYEAPGTSKPPTAKLRIVVAQEGDQWKVDGVFVD